MDENTMTHSSTELVLFSNLSNGEEINGTPQESTNLMEIPQPQLQESEFTTQPVVNLQDNGFVERKIVKGKVLELYLCGKCNRTFKQKTRYERHIANHPSEKHYLCETCNKTFTRMSHLEKHLRTHTDERRHVCKICGAAFILPHHLVRHNLIHSGDKPFQCDVCDKQFTRKAGLTQHKLLHTGVRPYSCDFHGCGRQFTDRTTLRRHLLVHSREKPFTCKECDKTFRTKSACRKHYLRHFKGTDSFKCGVCEEMFKGEEQLKAHAETHDEKQSTGAFRCGFCLRVFKSQADLDAHVPLHESGLVHACNHCAARFYTEEDLANHTGKHFGLTLEKDVYAIKDMNEEKSPSNINPQSTFQQPVNEVADANKVLVVLQLPHSLTSLKDEQGTLQIQNIQQLLGTARVDKLVVTTDRISNASQTLDLELSEDQQESIQSILQTTTVIQPDEGLSSMNDITGGISETADSTFPDLTSHDTLGEDDLSNPVQTSFVLKSLSQTQSSEKPVSEYLIVPPNGGNFAASKTSAFHQPSPLVANESMNSKAMINRRITSPPLESPSVFKQPIVAHKNNQEFQIPTEVTSTTKPETIEDTQNQNKLQSTNEYFQDGGYVENNLQSELLSQSNDSDFIVNE